MPLLLKIGILIGAFLMMEGVAWATHKYVMHGFLWSLHKSHHQKGPGFFEWNDFFFLFFGSIGATLILLGVSSLDWRFFMGAGITLYGLTYISLHDIFIHKRLKLFGRPDGGYLRAMQKAHRAHHSKTGKEGGESFGLLLFPRRHFRK